MGHPIKIASGWQRLVAGKGQMILAVPDPSGLTVWAGGSDPRGDGCAAPQV